MPFPAACLAVHPEELNLDDNKDIAIKVFGLVNLICEQMISHPKQVEALYNGLPEGKLKGINVTKDTTST